MNSHRSASVAYSAVLDLDDLEQVDSADELVLGDATIVEMPRFEEPMPTSQVATLEGTPPLAAATPAPQAQTGTAQAPLAGPPMMAEFFAVATAVKKLHHPNIGAVQDVCFTPEGECYLRDPDGDGVPLSERLESGRMAPEEALRLGAQLAAALAAAHAAGVTHNRLRPESIRIHAANGDRPARVELIDFGSSRLTPVEWAPYYAAPELNTGAADSQAADLYALGCALYHMLTGRVPFQGVSRREQPSAHASLEPVPCRVLDPEIEIPDAVDSLVRGLLAKQPQHRPLSARLVHEQLAEQSELLVARKQNQAVSRWDFQTLAPLPATSRSQPGVTILQPPRAIGTNSGESSQFWPTPGYGRNLSAGQRRLTARAQKRSRQRMIWIIATGAALVAILYAFILWQGI